LKLLDVLGTTSETFSVGLGENKIEFRTINGILHFRNFGSGWERASSASVRESLRAREYTPGSVVAEKELFYYNGALWYAETTFTASSFLLDTDKIIKVGDLNNFTSLNVAQYVSTPIGLTASSSNNIHFYGSTVEVSSIDVVLPNATFLHPGRSFEISNSSEITIRIIRNGQTSPIITIGAAQKASLLLIANANNGGDWYTFNYSSGGGGGGGGSSSVDATLNLDLYGGGNPFALGQIVTYNPLSSPPKWELATSLNRNLGIVGIVTRVQSTIIEVTFAGEISILSGLTNGTKYYLSDTIPGGYTSSPGVYNIPLFIANSTSSAILLAGDDEDRFNRRVFVTLTPNQTYTLSVANRNIVYEGYVLNDGRHITFKATIYPTSPIEATVETLSSLVIDAEFDGFLCFIDNGSDIIMKNKFPETLNLLIFIKGA
jgi:hypothetical protein